jgi:probable F420-dependent oxidoreductase
MKFGLSIPTLTGFPRDTEPKDGGWRTRWAHSFEIVALAEELGYAIGTVGHHRFTTERIDSSQPMVAIAALAARSTKIRFMTNILILPSHNPIDIAEQVAMVDELSDGRIILGTAIGYRPYEFEQQGLVFKERVSRFEEGITLLRGAWGDEPVHFEGKHFTVRGANVTPKPVQKPGPPIFIGAQVDAAIDRAARLGDGWLTDNIESAALLGPKVERFRQLSRAAGRSGTVVLNRKIGIGRDKVRLEREWLPPILDIYREYLRLGVPFDAEFSDKLSSGRALTIADLPPGQIIAGTPDECAEGVRLCIEATDPDYMIVDFGRGAHGAQYENLRDQIELVGREVMPRFANA